MPLTVWRIVLRHANRERLAKAIGDFQSKDVHYLGPSSVDASLWLAVFVITGQMESPHVAELEREGVEVRVFSQRELLSGAERENLSQADRERGWFSPASVSKGRRYTLQQLGQESAPPRDPRDDVGAALRFDAGGLEQRGHGWIQRFDGYHAVLADPEMLENDDLAHIFDRLAKTYPNATRFNHLPEASVEGRRVFIFRVGRNLAKTTPAVALVGGVQANQLASAQALVGLAMDFIEAAHADCSLSYPVDGKTKTFSRETIASIFDRLNLLFIPVVNPDGHEFSLKRDGEWRKNRRPLRNEDKDVGVNIDRNADFLWDFEAKIGELTNGNIDASKYEWGWDYIGSSAFSEPETRNIRHLLNDSPEIGWFVNVTAGNIPVIAHAFHHAKLQSKDKQMSYDNPDYDGRRGKRGYAQYMDEGHRKSAELLCRKLAEGSGSSKPDQTFFVEQPVPGNLEEYAYMHSLKRGAARPTLGFCFSPSGDPSGATVYEETMSNIAGGLLTFCAEIALQLAPPAA